LVYGLDTTGVRLLDREGLSRRRGLPGERYVRHVLDVAELYVGLVEQTRGGAAELVTFAAEPGSWWPDGRGGRLKPDAYLTAKGYGHMDHWWVEVDRATESLPTLRNKFKVYLEFYQRGGVGPGTIMPRVLVTVPHKKRLSDIVRLISQLPAPAEGLFIVTAHNDATWTIMRYLESD
jgi:hypothetical protein